MLHKRSNSNLFESDCYSRMKSKKYRIRAIFLRALPEESASGFEITLINFFQKSAIKNTLLSALL